MEALAAEIARKRKASADAAASSGGTASGPRKWVKKGDLQKAKEATYHKETAEHQAAEKERLVAPQFRYNQPGASEGAGSSSDTARAADESAAAAAAKAEAEAADKTKRLKPVEVRRLLRSLGQPIQLFGEDEAERLERYQAVSKALPSESEANDELKAGQMFDERQRFDASGRAIQAAAADEEHKQADEQEEDEFAGIEEGSSFVASTPEEMVAAHFKSLVKMWEVELTARSEVSR